MMETFRDQDDCIAYLEHLRWQDKPYCSKCEGTNVARKKDYHKSYYQYHCRDCKHAFNVLSGTIFSGTRTPLIKWFAAIALTIRFKKGISSYSLAETLDISQDNAWRMQDKMRQEMYNEMNEMFLDGLSGTCEMDETFANIKTKHPHSTWTGTTMILGVTSREGKVVARRAYDKDGESMQWFAKQYLDLDKSMLITDKWPGYYAMKEIMEHKFVKKNEYGQFVNSRHSNRIEGFWTTVKASLRIFHSIKEERIDRYMAELAFRYNNRDRSREEVFKYFIKYCLFKHQDKSYHLIHNSWML